MRKLIFVFVFFISHTVFAQQDTNKILLNIHQDLLKQINVHVFPKSENKKDTNGHRTGNWVIWLNKNHMETTSHEFTNFYRVCEYDNSRIIGKVQDFYLSGELRAKGKVVDGCWDESIIYYFPDGKIEQTEKFKKCQLNGKMSVYFNDGSIKMTGYFIKDDRSGEWIENYTAGKVKFKGSYLFGKRIGLWTDYSETGKLVEGEVYDDGEIVPKDDFVSKVINYTHENKFQKARDFITWIKNYYELYKLTNASRLAELDYYLSAIKFKKELYSDAMGLILKAVPKIKNKTLKINVLFTQLELAVVLKNHIVLEKSVIGLTKLISKNKQINLYDRMKYLEALGYYRLGMNIKAQTAIDKSSLDKWLQATYKGKSVFDDELQKYSKTKGNTLTFKPGEVIIIDIYFTELLLIHTKLQIRSEFYQEAYQNINILERMAQIGAKLKEFLQMLDTENTLEFVPLYDVRLVEYEVQKNAGQQEESVKALLYANELISANELNLMLLHSQIDIAEALVNEKLFVQAETLVASAITFLASNKMKDSYSYGWLLMLSAEILDSKKEVENAGKIRKQGRKIIRKTTK